MRACPYCQQDYVWEIGIRDLSGFFYMCFECDTVWTAPKDVVEGKGQYFEDFMVKQGRVPDWKAITKVKQINDQA
jgi:hypothetical protein